MTAVLGYSGLDAAADYLSARADLTTAERRIFQGMDSAAALLLIARAIARRWSIRRVFTGTALFLIGFGAESGYGVLRVTVCGVRSGSVRAEVFRRTAISRLDPRYVSQFILCGLYVRLRFRRVGEVGLEPLKHRARDIPCRITHKGRGYLLEKESMNGVAHIVSAGCLRGSGVEIDIG